MNIEKVTNMMSDFVAYVDDFYYEKSGIYPIKGMTNSMVIKAVQKYIQQLGDRTDAASWGGGDSLDRERVRDIILEDNDVEWVTT